MKLLIDGNSDQIQQFDTSILAGTKSPNTIEQYRLHFAAYYDFAAGLATARKAQPTDPDDVGAIVIVQPATTKEIFAVATTPATLASWRQHLYGVGYTLKDGTLKPYSIAAINQRLAAIRGLMAAAAEQGHIAHETAEGFKRVKGLKLSANKDRRKDHARTAISKDDMKRLLNAPDTTTPAGAMHRALLLTLATCGMRISEAISLKITDLQWESADKGAGWVAYVLGKNMDRPEPRPLGMQAKKAIDEWLQVRAGLGVTSEYIFTGFAGSGSRNPSTKPINRVSAWEMVQRYAKACGLAHIKPHDFRRYVGTQLANDKNRGLVMAQRQLGHKRIATTAEHYVMADVALGSTDDLV